MLYVSADVEKEREECSYIRGLVAAINHGDALGKFVLITAAAIQAINAPSVDYASECQLVAISRKKSLHWYQEIVDAHLMESKTSLGNKKDRKTIMPPISQYWTVLLNLVAILPQEKVVAVSALASHSL